MLSLVLHDVTRDDANGGAIRVAAGNVGSAVSWARLKARRFKRARSRRKQIRRAAQDDAASPPRKSRFALGKSDWWRADQRVTMTMSELESSIAEAVKKASPGCEDFVSVIVERTAPKSRLAPDWDVRGVRYGKADRPTVDEALAAAVKRMQQEIRLKPE